MPEATEMTAEAAHMITVFAQQSGSVAGGWEYVWGAYVATWLFFGGYAVTLWTRSREEL